MAPIQYSELTSSNGLNSVNSKTTSSSSSYSSSSSMAKSSTKSYSSSYKIVNGKVVDEFSNMSISEDGASSASEKAFKNGEQIINNSSNSSYSHHDSTGDQDLRNLKLKDVKSLLDFEPLGLFPIIERGLFFQDSFFSDWQQQWEEAVQEILDKFNARLPNTDDFTSYRTLRENDLREENQANSLEIEGNNYKIVVDVRDFMVGDLKVEAVGDDEIRVTGSVEQYDGKNVQTKTFNRKFHVPGPVDHSQVNATMSADGVLTIRVPKTSSQPQTPTKPKTSSPSVAPTSTPRRSYRRNAHGGFWKD